MVSVLNLDDFEACFYPEQPSCAQYHSPNFTLNGMNTVSSPLLPSHGYLPLPGPFDATPPFPMNFENALGPPYGGNGYILYPFPAAGVPPAGAADSSEATRISILDSAIGDQPTAIPSSEDELSLAVAGVDTAPEAHPSQGDQGDAPTSQPQAGPVLEEPSTGSHDYRRLPVKDPKNVDEYLESSREAKKKVYRCTWPDCRKEPFKRRSNARTHVHKHLENIKLFDCVVCLEQFASEDTARRHRNSQDKIFPCEHCPKKFARKDYRNVHQRVKCRMRNSVVPGPSGE